MEIILLIIYSIIVWLIFFKFKLLPWNITSQVIVVTIPIFALTALILFMNIVAPSSHDVRAMNYVIPIVPRVTGQVTEVPIEPNRPIKKGDVLFKMDPEPFALAVKAAEAKLASDKAKLVTAEASERGLQDQLRNASAKKAALTPRIDLAKKRVEQFTQLASTGAGKRADLEQAQADLGNLESEFLAADATESQVKQKLSARVEGGELDEVAQAKAQIAKSEADLGSAKYDLSGTVHLAPADGRVVNLALRPGVRATQFATMPVMSFVEEDNPWVLAFYHQNELRYVEPGDEAEIFVEMYPDRIIKCKVDSILWATAQGQMPISGNLPNTQPMAAPEQRIAVRLLLEPRDRDLFLAAGARGAGAIYTDHGKIIHIVRKVFLRVSTKMDWFVFKLH
ncbi:secretion protein HlyD family protein [Chthoniobacter flavus Ellin428]|uniref:Secretion protein HlyD family protein n=1 Tax=Chthoniobacter flavus Ellin428 TaxID=497964 RepID=B4CX64_9BACT|nr:HlyD family secretion protein [Chthoniobacter flavus]EDY20862.1 secretion protein HlyD family protein [Chthoniobacter flavus Ellin428]TCO85646.1 multidrug resistance efflux pump [Chthoniobacter flavus]